MTPVCRKHPTIYQLSSRPGGGEGRTLGAPLYHQYALALIQLFDYYIGSTDGFFGDVFQATITAAEAYWAATDESANWCECIDSLLLSPHSTARHTIQLVFAFVSGRKAPVPVDNGCPETCCQQQQPASLAAHSDAETGKTRPTCQRLTQRVPHSVPLAPPAAEPAGIRYNISRITIQRMLPWCPIQIICFPNTTLRVAHRKNTSNVR